MKSLLHTISRASGWVLLILGLMGVAENRMFANDTLKSIVIQKESAERIRLDDHMFTLVDTVGDLGIEEMLENQAALFTRNLPTGVYGKSVYVWAQFKLTNNSGTVRQYLLSFCGATFEDSVWLYHMEAGKLALHGITGGKVHLQNKPLPVRRTLIPFMLKENETVHFFVRIKYHENDDLSHLGHSYIASQHRVLYGSFNTFSFQSLFSGILMLFTLMGFFMFFFFRERIFLYYGLIILFFCYFFSQQYGHLFLLIPELPFYLDDTTLMYLAISGLSLFTFLFVTHYLNLKNDLPRWHYALFGLTVLIVIFPYTFVYLFQEQTMNVLMTLLLIWLIAIQVPLVLLARKGSREAKVLLWSMSLLFMGALLITLAQLGVIPANTLTTNALSAGVFAFSATLFYGLSERINNIQKEKLSTQLEKEKSDELLFKILPASVAEELKSTGVSKAKSISEISVLFTDFKSFTKVATKMSPEALVYEIDQCFRGFDAICEKYGIEKIKTIGDAYMAAGGLPVPGPESAKNTVLAALEMQDFIQNRKREMDAAGKPTFEMRVGIHTGPIVAGIVGVKKFQYDIWGDTVNTASRMESSGEVNKVNISQATYEALKDNPSFTFESRGKIEAKGKGEIEMWFVSKKG